MTDSGASAYVVRLWLPDVPGTLGRVAAAIGRADGDVIGIEILERGAGMAIDELIVTLPAPTALDRLVAELSRVDGAAVEDVHPVAPSRLDQSVIALDVAARIVEAPRSTRLDVTCRLLREMLESDWSVVIGGEPHGTGRVPLAQSGEVPDLPWVMAFVDGTSHLTPDAAQEYTPADVAWASFTPALHESTNTRHVVTGRRRGSFRLRERQHVSLIARIVGASLSGHGSVDIPVA